MRYKSTLVASSSVRHSSICSDFYDKTFVFARTSGAARMRPKRPLPLPKKLVSFYWCFLSIFNS